MIKKKDREEHLWDYYSSHKKGIFKICYTKDSCLRDSCTSSKVKYESWSFWVTFFYWTLVTNYPLSYMCFWSPSFRTKKSQSLWWTVRFEFATVPSFSAMQPVSNHLSQNFKYRISEEKWSVLCFQSCSWTVKKHGSHKNLSMDYKILFIQWRIFYVNIFTALQESIRIESRGWLCERKMKF